MPETGRPRDELAFLAPIRMAFPVRCRGSEPPSRRGVRLAGMPPGLVVKEVELRHGSRSGLMDRHPRPRNRGGVRRTGAHHATLSMQSCPLSVFARKGASLRPEPLR